MDRPEWLTCSSPWEMLQFLENRASDRKMRLVAVACCRRAERLSSDPRHRAVVDAAEHFTDGLGSESIFRDAMRPIIELWSDIPDATKFIWEPSHYMTAATRHLEGGGNTKHAASFAARGLARLAGDKASPAWLDARRAEESIQCMLIRDIFGDPFRPFRFDADWLRGPGSAAVSLAREIDEHRRFEALSLLADRLVEAECPHPEVIEHCRASSPHVHGCWVVDALLDRECAVREGLTTLEGWMTHPDPTSLLSYLWDRGTGRQWRLFAVACCRRIDHLITDPRSRRALEMAARYADAEIGEQELAEARAVAQEALEEAKYAEWCAEAHEGFQITPRYAAVCCTLDAALAVRGAVRHDPRRNDAAPGSFWANFCVASSDVWAMDAVRWEVVANSGSKWDERAVTDAGRLAQSEIVRDLFGVYLGPPGDVGAWLPNGEDSREWWCLLPTPVSIGPLDEWLIGNDGSIPRMARDIYLEERFDRLTELAEMLESAGCTEKAVLDHLRDPGPHFRGCWILDRLIDHGRPT